jgi:hypothetical protein
MSRGNRCNTQSYKGTEGQSFLLLGLLIRALVHTHRQFSDYL